MNWHCPQCSRELVRDECPTCSIEFPHVEGHLDLRSQPATDRPPTPLLPGDARSAHDHLAAGGPWKEALETLLADLPVDRAEALMLLLREGRGAWLAMAYSTGGRALFLGNALSGTVVALARSGYHVTVLDPAPERVRLAAVRNEVLAPGATLSAVGGDGPRLPFAADAFDLVVHEGGLPEPGSDWGHDLAEVRRVAREEFVLTADNRLGYKLSRHVRGEFRVLRPLEFLRRALRPPERQQSLAGYRRTLRAAGFEEPRPYALYPHAGEFAQVAALDEPEPRIFVGPLERRNRAKVWAERLGWVPWLVPSYAWSAGRRAARSRLDRILEACANDLNEPVPIAEHAIATRGNSIVVHTRPAPGNEGTGLWTLHIPLAPHQHALVARHIECLDELARNHPTVPAPRRLAVLEVDDTFVTVEQRIPGLSLSQLGSSPAGVLSAVGTALAQLVVEEARTFSDADLDVRIRTKVDSVVRYVRDAKTRQRVLDLGARVCDELSGQRLPLVLQHADLRPKHVLVAGAQLAGIVDWGSSTAIDLPYFDVLHVVVQARKQQDGLPPGAAWELARDARRLSAEERSVLVSYADRLGLCERSLRAIEEAYPVWVAAQAERTWDFTRPRWLSRQFGL